MDNNKPQKTLSIPASIVIVGVLIAGAIYFSANNSPKNVPVNTQTNQSVSPAPISVDANTVKIAGDPVVGNKDAPVTIAYWYDYQCPYCKINETTTMPQIMKDYVDTGKVKIVFKDFQFLGADSQTLGKFSHAVWEVSPAKFYQWHKTIFENQGTENTGWATQDAITALTKKVLNAEDTAKVIQLVADKGGEYQKIMDADKSEGASLGVQGTPAFIIGKQFIAGAKPYTGMKALIDSVAQ
jgi:protein-disulfide isomerase